MASTYELIIKAVDQTNQPLKNVEVNLKNIEKRTDRVNTAVKKVSRGFKSLGTAGLTKGLGLVSGGLKGVAASAAVAGTAFVALGVNALRTLDALDKTSDKLGVSVEFLSSFRKVADEAGLSTQQFDVGLQRFVRRLGEAQKGTGTLLKPLQELGIQLKDSNGNFRAAPQVFREYLNALNRTTNEADRLRLAFAAFDSEGTAFINIATMGSEAINEIIKSAREAGLVLTKEMTRGAADAQDAIGRLFDMGRGLQINFFAALAPDIERAAEYLRDQINAKVQAGGGMRAVALELTGQFLKGISSFTKTMSLAIDTMVAQFKSGINVIQQLLVGISAFIPGVTFTFDKPTQSASQLAEEIKNIDAQIEELAKANIPTFEEGEFIDTPGIGNAIEGLMLRKQALIDKMEEIKNTTVFEPFNTEVNTAQGLTKGLTEALDESAKKALETAANLREAAKVTVDPDAGDPRGDQTGTGLSAAQKKQIELNEALLPLLKATQTAEQKLQEQYTNKTNLINQINEQLRNNTALTDTQKRALEENKKALFASREEIGMLLKAGPDYIRLYNQSTGALKENKQAIENVTHLKEQLLMQMKDERFNTDENRVLLIAYNAELKRLEEQQKSLLGVQAQTNSGLLTYNQYLNDLLKSSREDVQLSVFQSQAKAELKTRLDEGKISLDQYAAAMERLGTTQKTTNEETLTYAKYLEDLKDAGAETVKIDGFRKKAQKELNALIAAGVGPIEAYKAALASITDTAPEKVYTLHEAFQEFFKSTEAGFTALSKHMKQNIEDYSKSLATSLVKSKNVLGDFKNFFLDVLDQIAIAIVQEQITRPFISGITGFLGNTYGSGNWLDNLIGSIFPGRATGGPVSGNSPYIVGERGPELFMPTSSGTITPNDELNMGGGDTNITFQINAIDTQTGTQFLLENKPKIISMITQAQNQRGRQGITT